MANSFTWLSLELVRGIHARQLDEHGGAPGVRDPGLLDSALARPQNAALYGDASPFELAGLYARGIIKNHPFIDGNKRVGAVLLELFLDQNGYALTASDADFYTTIYDVAAGAITDQAFFDWIRANSAPQ